jgi:hypothetical protein
VGDAAGIGARGRLQLHEAGHGHGVLCPSPCTITPVLPQSLQHLPSGGAGSGGTSGDVTIVARAAAIDAAARADSRPMSAGSAESHVRNQTIQRHMCHHPRP